MSKIREFFANLRKSTKITLISCVSFVMMTFIILCFFIMSPITPADKAGKTFGRESISADGSTVSTIVTTIDENGNTVEVSKGTTNVASTASTVTTTKKDYVITITTGTGYYVDGKIIIGDYDGYTYNYTTTTAYSGYSGGEYTTTTYYSGGEEPITTTAEGGSDEPVTENPNSGEIVTEPPVVTEPQQTTEPVIVTEPPVVTEPVKPTDPPVDQGQGTPPPESGGETGETW